MKIRIEGGRPAPKDVLLVIEQALGTRLSESYRSFLLSHDGAKPESNCFDVGLNNASEVRRLLPAAEIIRQRGFIENLPEKAYPIAEDSCGNFVVIDEARKGAVYFWDHETRDLTEVAADFATFLECLRPFDTATVDLKPEQVKRVWIDPEFRRRHPESFKVPPGTDDTR